MTGSGLLIVAAAFAALAVWALDQKRLAQSQRSYGQQQHIVAQKQTQRTDALRQAREASLVTLRRINSILALKGRGRPGDFKGAIAKDRAILLQIQRLGNVAPEFKRSVRALRAAQLASLRADTLAQAPPQIVTTRKLDLTDGPLPAAPPRAKRVALPNRAALNHRVTLLTHNLLTTASG